jgi:hypothetical protein
VRDRTALASILALLACQRCQTEPAILRNPRLCGSIRNARCLRDGRQGLTLLDVRLDQSKPIKRKLADLFRQRR